MVATPIANATMAFTRFGLGPRFDLPANDRAAIMADPRSALKAELLPSNAALQGSELTSTKDVLTAYFMAQQQLKMLRDQMSPNMAQASNMAETAPTQMANSSIADAKAARQQVKREAIATESQARFQKAFDSKTGFVERLVYFWSNHFCVSANKGGIAAVAAGSFEREAIRPFVFGKFADMLLAVEQHPAMLFYLDNRDSMGPNSKAGQNRKKGLNENLAREIMELHTLGVKGGYNQADVTFLARMITGWTFPGINNKNAGSAVFTFNANAHEPGASKLLGKSYDQQGIAQGETALRDLARHPATATHIAFKFARHFVADDPPPQLVQKLTKNFQGSDGDLKALAITLLDDDSAWNTPAQKLRSPQEYLLAASRALNLPPNNPQPLVNALNTLGQPLWRPPGPNGHGDTQEVWASPEGMKVRLSYAAQMGRQTQITGNPVDILGQTLGDSVSTETRQAVARAESRQQALALMLMSPEFQLR